VLAEELESGPLRGLRIGVLHGQLAVEEKDAVMSRFIAGPTDSEGLDVLVSTTVIEVGVDIPTASMMVIMDADRFGVSQLHQLRGRIGRGGQEALCLFFTQAPGSSEAAQRLEQIAATNDGFVLARLDLEQRREGDVLGEAQSGRRSSLRLLSVLRDEATIEQARQDAVRLVEQDPDLAEYPDLKALVDRIHDEQAAEYLEKA
jgi:ATP-dependent DNA helicase RecG